MKISVVIPARNEMNSVGDVVRRCKPYCHEVIVVDDASTDDTLRVSQAAGATIVRNRTNLGVVRSTEIGLRLSSGDIIVTLDADGQHDPSDIPNITRPIMEDEADLVLGTREEVLPLSERMIAALVNLRVKCSDVGTGYRALRRDLAQKIRLWGFCLCGSLVLEAKSLGARITEVPITTGPRKFGRSHLPTSLSRGRMHFKQAIIILCQLLH